MKPVCGLEELVGGRAVDLFTYVTARITLCVFDVPSTLWLENQSFQSRFFFSEVVFLQLTQK